MIRPDIIISWPKSCDYPLWRQYIHDYRAQFNEIIVVFTETNQGYDYRDFIRKSLFKDHVFTIECPAVGSGQDWRDVAVHAALLQSYNAPWIWFTEQDFLPKATFWEQANLLEINGAEVIGVNDGGPRLHPCSLLIRRETLNQKTERIFAVVPDKSDHFSLIERDLGLNKALIEYIDPIHWSHMNGLSHNFSLITRGEIPNWRKNEFDEYLKKSLKVAIPLDENYVKIVTNYLANIA